MIFELIIGAFFSVLNFIFSFMALPAAPLIFVDAINSVVPFMAVPIAVVRVYVGEQFFVAMITLIIAAFSLFILLRPAMWLYNKIRGAGN